MVELEGSEVQGHPWLQLHNELEAIMGSMRSYLKKPQNPKLYSFCTELFRGKNIEIRNIAQVVECLPSMH